MNRWILNLKTYQLHKFMFNWVKILIEDNLMKNNITVLSAWEINLELNSFLCQDVNIFFVESVLSLYQINHRCVWPPGQTDFFFLVCRDQILAHMSGSKEVAQLLMMFQDSCVDKNTDPTTVPLPFQKRPTTVSKET